ncbi:MAG: hypothetical protein H6722_06280 [Sandaracinus sp.]|nr:hypothetical protein [Sandaracinus sp.]MCB9612047.1 hypothetical protein [Sandaracinus sp.]
MAAWLGLLSSVAMAQVEPENREATDAPTNVDTGDVATGGEGTNAANVTAASTNATSTNATSTNATSTNATSTNATSTNAAGTNATSTNAAGTNATSTNAATVAPDETTSLEATNGPAQVESDAEPTLRWLPGAEIFFAYRYQVIPDDGTSARSWFHVFELERTLAWLGARYGDLEARVMLEAVQGADEAGLLAVAGDSMVLRVREAWMGYELLDRVRIRAGIVPELTQPFVESVESLRPIGKGPHERFGLLAPADAGANVTVRLPLQLGEVGVGVYSGESYRSRELNRGKSTELFVRLHPLATIAALRPLVVGGGYFLGSEGAGSARANRATVVLGWDSPWLKVGGSFTHAQGFAGNGSRTGWLVHGFARLELLNRLLVGARVVHFRRDVDASDDTVSTYQGSVGVRILEPLETYLVLTRNVAGERAAAALPGSDSWELSAVVRGRLEER